MPHTPRGIYYPALSSTVLPASRDFKDLAMTADAAISRVTSALPLGRALSAADNLRDLEPGVYWVSTYATAVAIQGTNPHFPSPASGTYIVWPGTYQVHEWRTTGLSSRPNEIWQSERQPAGWTDWWRTDARAASGTIEVQGGSGGSGSGFKVVPVTLTRDGNGGSSKTTRAERTERLRHICTAPSTRLRVHIQNANLRSNETLPGALEMTGLWWGEHDANGNYLTTPEHVHGEFTTPADGSEWASPWLHLPMERGKEYLLSFGFTASSGQEFFYHIGQSYATDSAADAGAQTHQGAGNARALLDVWLEVETYATTPVIATIGSSTPTGVGADWPVQQSVISLLADQLHALPMHYGGSGDTMAVSSNFDWDRWTRWEHLAKPDAIIMMQHTNDVFEAGMTMGVLQARYMTLMEYLTGAITPHVYLTTATPRTNVTDSREQLRRDFNSWMKILPHGAMDCFDMVPAVSNDDETLLPEYDSGDGYHLNTSGHAALASAFDRPITTPPVVYQTI